MNRIQHLSWLIRFVAVAQNSLTERKISSAAFGCKDVGASQKWMPGSDSRDPNPGHNGIIDSHIPS